MLRLAHSYRHPLLSEEWPAFPETTDRHMEKGMLRKASPRLPGRLPRRKTFQNTRYLSAKSAPGVPPTVYVFNIRPYRSYSYTIPLPVPDFASPM